MNIRSLWNFYPETRENDYHNDHSGHKQSSESCKLEESMSARDQYEKEIQTVNKGGE
jgi:hypothetical protein